MIGKTCHYALKVLSKRNYDLFNKSLSDPKLAQENVLDKILSQYSKLYPDVKNLEHLRERFPVSNYENWKERIDNQKLTGRDFISLGVERFEPTSGSTQNVKWIPYTKSFLSELQGAYEPWLYDLYHRYPDINEGTHYWSLSWLPDDMRSQSNNEADLFPKWKRYFLKRLMTLDSNLAYLPTSELAKKVALLSLLSKDISLISIWSPTYLLSLIEMMVKSKNELIFLLKDKTFQRDIHIFESKKCIDRSLSILESMTEFNSDVARELWPDLKLMSMWDTSLSKKWADHVRNLFPHTIIQGKGLWATEGVLTIPFKNHYPVALNSHFYEFENLDDGKILCTWEIEEGMRVKPLMTTGSGLFRYELNDELVVKNFIDQTPCLEFVGRINDVDIAGEKLAISEISKISQAIEKEFDIQAITVFANNRKDSPRKYEMLVEGIQAPEQINNISNKFENLLLDNFHYRLARDLGQLEKASAKGIDNGIQYYYDQMSHRVKVSGDIKIEQVVVLNE